jgi:hypothetical protein
MSKFKVGNKIVVNARTRTLNNEIKIGDIRTVTDTQSNGVQLDSIADGWVHDVDIELASKIIKPKWSIYNNTLPWSKLSDKKKRRLLLANNNGLIFNGFTINSRPNFSYYNSVHAVRKCESVEPEPTMAELFDADAGSFDFRGSVEFPEHMISKGWSKS